MKPTSGSWCLGLSLIQIGTDWRFLLRSVMQVGQGQLKMRHSGGRGEYDSQVGGKNCGTIVWLRSKHSCGKTVCRYGEHVVQYGMKQSGDPIGLFIHGTYSGQT